MDVCLMEGGIARLQSPLLPSRLVDLGFGAGSLWRWGVLLLLAAVAAYGSLIARIRLLIRFFRLNRRKLSIQQHPPPSRVFSDDDGDDEDDAWESCSSESEIEEERLLSPYEDRVEEDEIREGYVGDFAEYGSRDGRYEMRWLSELAAQGREIVKAWREEAKSLRPLWDLGTGELVRSFAAPAVVLSAGDSVAAGRMKVQVWDSRTSVGIQAISSDFSVHLRRRVLNLGGDGKVLYVSGGDLSSPVVDLRNVRSPVGGFWDDVCADAVVVTEGNVAALRPETSRSNAGYRFS